MCPGCSCSEGVPDRLGWTSTGNHIIQATEGRHDTLMNYRYLAGKKLKPEFLGEYLRQRRKLLVGGGGGRSGEGKEEVGGGGGGGKEEVGGRRRRWGGGLCR